MVRLVEKWEKSCEHSNTIESFFFWSGLRIGESTRISELSEPGYKRVEKSFDIYEGAVAGSTDIDCGEKAKNVFRRLG